MSVQEFVKENWATLPKSMFNEDEVVIVKTISDEQEGWGHHSYSGVGVNKDGAAVWCYSSGCSCSGSCGVEHRPEAKVFEVDGDQFDFKTLDPATLKFEDMQVGFSDY